MQLSDLHVLHHIPEGRGETQDVIFSVLASIVLVFYLFQPEI